MTETKQLTTEEERPPIVPEQEQLLPTSEELQRAIEEGRTAISQFEKGEEDRAAGWLERQSNAGADPKIVGAASVEFNELAVKARGFLSTADQNLAAIGYRETGEYIVGTDGKPSLAFIEEAPKPEKPGVREPKSGEVYVGAVQKPDGTWDMSQALRMSDESAKEHNFRWDADQLIKLYREAYEKDESYRDEGGLKKKFDRAESELRALANAEEGAGKAGDYLIGLEMVVDRVIDDNTDMITDVESLDKGTITEDDHKKMAQDYERNNEMFGYIGEKLFPNANCELSAANYDDMLRQMSRITGSTRAENNDVSWYFPEGMGPDNMQNILESGDPEKIKLLALHFNTVASEAMIAFCAVAQGLYGENHSYRDKDGSAAQAAEFAYRLRNMTQEAVKLAYNGEEGRTIFDAQKDLFGGQGQEKGSANDTVEAPPIVEDVVGAKETGSGDKQVETSKRLDEDLDALRTLSKTGLPALFNELDRVQAGQNDQRDFEFVADDMDTPIILTESSGEVTESIGELLQVIKNIQELCRDESIAIEEKNSMYIQEMGKLQGLLEQRYGITPQKSEPGSGYDRRSQQVVGRVKTGDPLLAGKVAESRRYGLNNPDYVYQAKDGVVGRTQTIGYETVTVYEYDPSTSDGNSQKSPAVVPQSERDDSKVGPSSESDGSENPAGGSESDREQVKTKSSDPKKTTAERERESKDVGAFDLIRLIRSKDGDVEENITKLVGLQDRINSTSDLTAGADVMIANRHEKEAENFLRKAEEINPENENVQYQLQTYCVIARFYTRFNNFNDDRLGIALSCLNKAREIAGDRPVGLISDVQKEIAKKAGPIRMLRIRK